MIFGLKSNKRIFIADGISSVVFYFALAIPEVKMTVIYSQKSSSFFEYRGH